MQITLNEQEIKKAIISFVGNQGITIAGKNTDITLIAGRGANGMSASIDITDADDDTPKAVVEITNPEDVTNTDVVEEDPDQMKLFGQN